MVDFYAFSDTFGYLIHSQTTNLYLSIFHNSHLGKSYQLSNNYLSDFSAIIHEGALHYSFLNSQKQVFLYHYPSLPQNALALVDRSNQAILPQLVSFQNTILCFFYIFSATENTYTLHATAPYNSQIQLSLDTSFPQPYGYTLIAHTNHLFLLVHTPELPTQLLIHKNFLVEKISSQETEIAKLSQLLDHSKQQIQSLEHALASASSQYDQLIATATAYKNDAKKWHENYIKVLSR